ncbi:MAG: hypothetical protein ACON4H_11825 [Rubripirellula sp.]
MRTLLMLFFVASSFAALTEQASANHGNLAGFLPFGYYQPYGASYSSSVRTPPYFATNPPVYYSHRYSRPYGLSPFASPPMLQSPAGYAGRPETPSAEIRVPESASERVSVASLPTAIGKRGSVVSSESRVGPVRSNPFASEAKQLVRN